MVFFINIDGGHGGSSGHYDRIREQDRGYAFMLTQLGIAPVEGGRSVRIRTESLF